MAWTLDIVDGKNQNDTDFYNFANDLGDGVSFCAGTTDLKVTPSGTPAMSVVLKAGKIYLYISSKNSYFSATLDTDTTLSVASNSSGSTRIDIVCVKFDTGVTSNSAGTNVVSTQYVQGTAGAGVPSTPANYTKVAEVTVPSGATTINDGTGGSGSIADKRHALVLNMGEVQFIERSATPATNPPAGAMKLYFKTDGALYTLDNNGNESSISGGWSGAGDTWVYASANSFTIAGFDRTAIYTKGTRVKWNEGATLKYGVVYSSSFSTNTTVTLFANSDYKVTNTTLTLPYYSYSLMPTGYPTWFNTVLADLTLSAGGSMTFTSATVNLYKFAVEGKKVTLIFDISGTTGGTTSTVIQVTLPGNPDNTSNHYRGGAQVSDGADIAGQYYLSGVANILHFDSANYGIGAGIVIRGTIIYGF